MTTIISPHIDDAAFSLGLLIDKVLKHGDELIIVNCFSISDFTLDKRCNEVDKVTALRKMEDRILNQLFRNQIKFEYLDMFDAPVRNRGVYFDEALTAEDYSVIEQLTFNLLKVLPTSAQVYTPLSVGNHIDHVICLESVISLSLTGQYRLNFYEDLPYSQWVSKEVIHEKVKVIEQKTNTTLSPQLITFEDIEVKSKFVNCYASQINDRMINDIMRYATNLRGERTWHVQRSTA